MPIITTRLYLDGDAIRRFGIDTKNFTLDEVDRKIEEPIMLSHYGHDWGKEKVQMVYGWLLNGEPK